DGLLRALDRDLGDEDGGGLYGQVGREDGEEIRVALALAGESVGKGVADGAVFAADQEVDVSDFVAFADEGFADVHGHGKVLQTSVLLMILSVMQGNKQRGGCKLPGAGVWIHCASTAEAGRHAVKEDEGRAESASRGV